MGKEKRKTSPKEKKRVKLRPGLEKNLVKLHRKIKDKSDDQKRVVGKIELSKFARALASTDWHTRERALRSLELWLSMSDNLESKDLRKVWKGLFFCFWHSDKVPVQQELAERLSKLVSELKPLNVAVTFWETFLETMAREWSSIDRLRLDKFMSLVRIFIHACLVRCCNEDWHPDVVVPLWELLGRMLLQVDNAGHVMTGLTLHITHVFVDELEQVCIKVEEPGQDLPDTIPADVLSYFVDPFKFLLCTCSSMAVVERVVDSVYGKLVRKCFKCLKEVEGKGAEADSETLRNGYPFVQMDAFEMVKELFEVAADAETRQYNREKIYDVIAFMEPLADFQQKTRKLSSPSTSDSKRGDKHEGKTINSHSQGGKSEKKRKQKKKGVVFKLKNNQVFNFHKKVQANVTYSPSSHVPKKGALKVTS